MQLHINLNHFANTRPGWRPPTSPSTTGTVFQCPHQLPIGRARSLPSTPEKRVSTQLTPRAAWLDSSDRFFSFTQEIMLRIDHFWERKLNNNDKSLTWTWHFDNFIHNHATYLLFVMFRITLTETLQLHPHVPATFVAIYIPSTAIAPWLHLHCWKNSRM